jgi:hypothetical protein
MSYIPARRKPLNPVSGIVTVAQEAAVPFVVKYFPSLPDCEGSPVKVVQAKS